MLTSVRDCRGYQDEESTLPRFWDHIIVGGKCKDMTTAQNKKYKFFINYSNLINWNRYEKLEVVSELIIKRVWQVE